MERQQLGPGLTDDQRQLAYERQRLDDVRAKRDRATDEGDRFYYTCAVQGWERSIAVLERRVNEAAHCH
jgi:hypothetical protein